MLRPYKARNLANRRSTIQQPHPILQRPKIMPNVQPPCRPHPAQNPTPVPLSTCSQSCLLCFTIGRAKTRPLQLRGCLVPIPFVVPILRQGKNQEIKITQRLRVRRDSAEKRSGDAKLAYRNLRRLPHFHPSPKAVGCFGWYSPTSPPPGSFIFVIEPHRASAIFVQFPPFFASDAFSEFSVSPLTYTPPLPFSFSGSVLPLPPQPLNLHHSYYTS